MSIFFICYIIFSIYILYKVVDICTVKDTDQRIVNRLYYLLDEISTEFDKNDVEYIMVGGTLLGSVRHGGLIPWDDDGDICVLNKTPEEILEILKPLKKRQILSREHVDGNVIIASVNNHRGYLDIFFMGENNNKYKFLYPYNVRYPTEWFYKNELYPIKKYMFGPLVLKGPNKFEEYLSRTYGNDWNNKAIKWNHKSFIPDYSGSSDFYHAFPKHIN